MSEQEAGFFEYKPLQPYTQAELAALHEQWTREERERIIKLLDAELHAMIKLIKERINGL